MLVFLTVLILVAVFVVRPFAMSQESGYNHIKHVHKIKIGNEANGKLYDIQTHKLSKCGAGTLLAQKVTHWLVEKVQGYNFFITN